MPQVANEVLQAQTKVCAHVLRFRVKGSEVMVYGLRIRTQVFGFRIQGLTFGIQDSGFRV